MIRDYYCERCHVRHIWSLPQAHPYEKPGIWPDLRTALFDVALALLFWVGIIAALYWLWIR